MTKKTTAIARPSEEEQKREALLIAFEQIATHAGQFIRAFDTEKYRLLVTINHQELDSNGTLIKELICYHFNVTISMNKHGLHYLYFNHDTEAVTKFTPRVYNQMLRLIMLLTHNEVAKVNIEDRVRIAPKPADLRNFFYKRLIDGEKPFIHFTKVDKQVS